MKALRIITVILFVLAVVLYCGVTYRYDQVLDRVSPQIQCGDTILEVSVTAPEEALLAGLTASDDRDGDLTDKIMVQGISRLLTADTARVTYVVFDSSDNMASCTRTIRYTDYQRPVITLSDLPVYRIYPEDDSLQSLLGSLSARDVRDGDLSGQIRISAQNVDDTREGTFAVNVQVTNSMGDTEIIPLTIMIDNEGAADPLVTLREYIRYLRVGDDFDPTDDIVTVNGSAYTGTSAALTIESDVDTSTAGYYQVCYRCEAGSRSFTVYQTVVVR